MAQSSPTSPAMCISDLISAEKECPGATTAIIAETPYQYRVDRPTVKCLLSAAGTSTRLTPNLRLVPAVENGSPIGFRLFGIRPGSLPGRLGLRNGDTLRSVNGLPLTGEDSIAAAYHRIRTASYIFLNVERGAPGARSLVRLRYLVSGSIP